MACVIVADGGSTTIDWGVSNGHGKPCRILSTTGLNALLATDSEIEKIFTQALNSFESDISEASRLNEDVYFYYYGAGCATEEVCSKIKLVARKLLPENCNIKVGSDLTGAAVALFHDSEGIACILGTGSNSGYYDGKRIVENIPPLGYILGDEGSGASIGKRFLNRCFKGCLPKDIQDEFFDFSGLTLPDVLNKVYRQPGANQFLASIIPFISRHIDNHHIREIVTEEMQAFMKLNVDGYRWEKPLNLGFVGSIAVIFHDIIEAEVTRRGFKLNKIIKRPIEEMLNYYSVKHSK